MKSVRLWYKKSGLAVYTSHLDMNRCFTRAVRRAEIPLWYTEGFNPHPYLTFLLPLPLGQTGLREPVDIRTEAEISNEEIKERLNSVLPDGLEIIDVTQGRDDVHSITQARYSISLEFNSQSEAERFSDGAAEKANSGELNAEKKTKKGIKTINLCDYIYTLAPFVNDKTVTLDAVLATGSEKNLNAGLLTDTLVGEVGTDPQAVRITRAQIYTNNLIVFE